MVRLKVRRRHRLTVYFARLSTYCRRLLSMLSRLLSQLGPCATSMVHRTGTRLSKINAWFNRNTFIAALIITAFTPGTPINAFIVTAWHHMESFF